MRSAISRKCTPAEKQSLRWYRTGADVMEQATGRISSLGTVREFLRNGTCSETLCNVLDRAYDRPLPLEERAAQNLAGGMMKGYQCGQLWGAALAAGAQ